MRIAALISGGKDSLFAAYKAGKKHKLICLITIKSENPDSYMFHTPNIDVVELQAKAMDLPIIIQRTKGEKEKELIDLKQAINKAKDEFKIQGVVSGALFSNYQKERIEKICSKLKLKLLSPLWHIDQEKEMREILNNKFKIIFSSIAAYGLDKNWLGRIITNKDIDKLVELNKKYKINIAGEGGETESLVLDCPLFKKKIVIKKAQKRMENEFTGRYVVEAALE